MGTDMQRAESSREHTYTMAGYLGCTFPTAMIRMFFYRKHTPHFTWSKPASSTLWDTPCCRTLAPWDHEVVAATASGQSHLDAAVYLEEKHFLQGLVLRGTAFLLPFFFPEIVSSPSRTAY